MELFGLCDILFSIIITTFAYIKIKTKKTKNEKTN